MKLTLNTDGRIPFNESSLCCVFTNIAYSTTIHFKANLPPQEMDTDPLENNYLIPQINQSDF